MLSRRISDNDKAASLADQKASEVAEIQDCHLRTQALPEADLLFQLLAEGRYKCKACRLLVR